MIRIYNYYKYVSSINDGPLVNSLLCVFNQQQGTQMLPSVQCIFIGDCGVGKTTLLKTATHQRMHCLPTVGVDLISYNSDNLRLQCWDTSGQPRFIHVVQMFVKNCSVIVYMFDATLEDSFLSILQTHEQHHKQDKNKFLRSLNLQPETKKTL